VKFFLSIICFYIIGINTCNQNPHNTTKTVESKSVLSNSETNEKASIEETQTINPEQFFSLIHATSEKWVAGIPDGGRGTDYYFEIKINTVEKLLFDSAWIDNKAFEIFIAKKSNYNSSQQIIYGQGDTITLRVSDIQNKSIPNKITNPPIKHDGIALIGYSVNAKRKYLSIKEIKSVKSANRN